MSIPRVFPNYIHRRKAHPRGASQKGVFSSLFSFSVVSFGDRQRQGERKTDLSISGCHLQAESLQRSIPRQRNRTAESYDKALGS